MMMKKTTSALAVAALLGTGAASAATFQVDENTSFSVGANLGYTYKVVETSGNSESDLIQNSSDFRFAGEHTSDNGLTSLLYIELDNFVSTDSVATTITSDQTFVGLRGDFGTVRLGSDLGTYGSVDGLKDIDQYGGLIGFGNDAENGLRYDFPTAGNLSASIAANVYDDNSGGTKSGTSVNGSLTYDLGAVAISAAYDNRGGEQEGNDEPFYGLGAQFDVAGVDTRVTYESDTDPDKEVDLLSVTGVYSFGNSYVYGVMQNVSGDEQGDVTAALGDNASADDDSITQYNVGYGYSFTDNASVVFETSDKGAVDDEGNVYSATVYFGF